MKIFSSFSPTITNMLCNTTHYLPFPSLEQHNHLSFPISLPLPIKLNQKTKFTLSCASQSHSSDDLSDYFSHASNLSLSPVSCSSSDLAIDLLEVAIKDHKYAQDTIQEWFRHNSGSISTDPLTMEEFDDLKALFVMSKYTEFEIKFFHTIEKLKVHQESNLSKLPVELVKSMKLRTGELQVQLKRQAEENRGDSLSSLLMLKSSYKQMMFCGLTDHHNQEQKAANRPRNKKNSKKAEYKEKSSSSVVLLTTRLMQLFHGIDRNHMYGIMEFPAVLIDAYLYGAFCSMCYDELLVG